MSHHLLSGRVPMMTLVHTLAVAEYLNFRHAANALGVAQSSVSARVKALMAVVQPAPDSSISEVICTNLDYAQYSCGLCCKNREA
ncbi:helix-turn-helix domain-containing protein [Pseudomonas aeruginosa]|nr:LysR family transcriptional regulator [Pseudomonas aeruginosa]